MDKRIEKGLLIGLGALSLTKKKAEKAASVLVKNKLLGKKEAKALAGKVVSEVKKANAVVNKVVLAEIKKQLGKAKPAAKKYASKAGREGRKVAKILALKVEKIAKQIGQSLK